MFQVHSFAPKTKHCYAVSQSRSHGKKQVGPALAFANIATSQLITKNNKKMRLILIPEVTDAWCAAV